MSPYLRLRCPIPPPSVSPPTPVDEMIPEGVASPCSWAAASTMFQLQPPPARIGAVGGVDLDRVQAGEVEHDAVVADAEAAAVVAAAADGEQQVVVAGERDRRRDIGGVWQYAISAGRRSIIALNTVRASS